VAHHLVGGLVSEAHERGVRLRDVVAAADGFGDEALSIFEPGSAVRRRTTPGGAGPVPGARQRESLAAALDVARARASALAGRTAPA
jgi:argininosuccinate lyase